MCHEMPRCPDVVLMCSNLAGSLPSEHLLGLHRPSGLWVDVHTVCHTSWSEHLTAGGDVPVCPSPAITGDVPSGRGPHEPASEESPLKSTLCMY